MYAVKMTEQSFKKVETSKKLDENHNQYKTSLKENLKIRLEKLSSNKAVRKNLKT
jgi:hypothetical protein